MADAVDEAKIVEASDVVVLDDDDDDDVDVDVDEPVVVEVVSVVAVVVVIVVAVVAGDPSLKNTHAAPNSLSAGPPITRRSPAPLSATAVPWSPVKPLLEPTNKLLWVHCANERSNTAVADERVEGHPIASRLPLYDSDTALP